jgi:hypothetical protein|tara:strand:+ start:333 stop:839 length:507 start_codon:yes stop_codon:yes gene_type:complete
MSDTPNLNPSIVVLKSGDKLITILQEVFEGEGEDRKGVCLLMNYPYELALIKTPSEDDPAGDLQVKFSKWCPYSIENSFRIPYDGILTIGSPDPGLAGAYQAKVDQQKAQVEPEATPPAAPPTNVELPTEGSGNDQAQRADIEAAMKGIDVKLPADESVPAAVTPEVV